MNSMLSACMEGLLLALWCLSGAIITQCTTYDLSYCLHFLMYIAFGVLSLLTYLFFAALVLMIYLVFAALVLLIYRIHAGILVGIVN